MCIWDWLKQCVTTSWNILMASIPFLVTGPEKVPFLCTFCIKLGFSDGVHEINCFYCDLIIVWTHNEGPNEKNKKAVKTPENTMQQYPLVVKIHFYNTLHQWHVHPCGNFHDNEKKTSFFCWGGVSVYSHQSMSFFKSVFHFIFF